MQETYQDQLIRMGFKRQGNGDYSDGYRVITREALVALNEGQWDLLAEELVREGVVNQS